MMVNDCNLKVESVLNLFNCRDNDRREDIIAYIGYDLEDGINIDKFRDNDDIIYCNVGGAKIISEWLNIDFPYYIDTLTYLNSNKRKTEIKRQLCTDINLKYTEDEQIHFNRKDNNKYISSILQGISLNGKTLDEVDNEKLSDRDIKTINGSINKYNNTAKAGHNDQSDRILNSYKYIEDKDPDIAKRALYNYDYKQVDLDEQYMKLRNMDFCTELQKALRANKKKFKKRMKRKKNRKFINDLYETQYPDTDE